jgi:hypothetical protein
MKLLAKFVTGNIALWRTFWLIGIPLALVWDITGACMVFGFSVEEPLIAGSIIALFALSSAAIPLVSVAIWRSSSNYLREVWWHGPLALGAKLCAVFSGLVAALSVLGLLYLAYDYIYAALTYG